MAVGRRPFWIPDATVIKKAALILFTFSALVGAHLAYTQAFVIIAERLAATGDDDLSNFPESIAESSLRSNQLAEENFGAGHWTTQAVKISYYDQSRGSYLYAQNYQRKNAGKTMVISPFAMISLSKDGKSHKTVTSDSAIVDMSQPFGLMKTSGEASRITHAELIGNVRIRDDKGTPENAADDLLIGPLNKKVEFDEKTMQITSDSDVVIQDQDMIITGIKLMIQLRRKNPTMPGAGPGVMSSGGGGGSGGYDTETMFLYHDVHIVIKNVTPGGILVGQSKPDAKGQTPLDLRCMGQMRIDMPKPQPIVVVGPPNPFREPEPTYARFEQNVRVIRGAITPDQLNCDMLYLTLKPDPKALNVTPANVSSVSTTTGTETLAAATEPPAASGGPLTQLKLRSALAQGHAVWVQSESQGLNAKCVELRYEKHLDEGTPDKTYLYGGSSKKIHVEKVDYVSEGENVGSIKSVMTLDSLDATILDYGPGGTSKIVARGPGKTDERPSRSKSITREAWFEDQMMLQSWRDSPKPVSGDLTQGSAAMPPLRRLLTLTGLSTLKDLTSSSTLDAKEKIVAEFESGPKPSGSNGTDGPSRIKWLQAFDNVHLSTPGRTLTAWRKFEAWFVQPEPPSTLKPAAIGPGTALAANVPVAPSGPIGDGETPLPESKPEAPPAPVEGAVDGRANYVHATIVQGTANAKGEVRDAKLRGAVMVHQEPAPGERFGKDASGEALDLFNQGKGMMKFAVAAEEPQATNPEPKTKLAAGLDPKTDSARSRLASKGRPTSPKVLARVEFDGKIIESEKIIGLDQQANFAWSLGHGSLVQMAEKGLLDDKGLASDKSKPKGQQGPTARDNLTISWNEEMRFFGKSRDKQGREVAKAEFRGRSEEVQTPDGRRVYRRGVEALMTDSAILCDSMDVYMDKTIDFSKSNKNTPGSKPPTDPAPVEPQAEIAMVESWGDNLIEDHELKHAGVDITSQKFFQDTRILKEKQRIQHTHVIYDKRTGDFEGSGAGRVFLYQGSLPKTADRLAVRTVSTPVVKAAEPTVKLTKIHFTELMRGRFGVAREGVETETRTGEFVGGVQAANAVVLGRWSDLDFDQLDKKPDAVFLTSDVLRVRSEPIPDSKGQAHQLLYAKDNAAAKTVDRIIQGDRITYDSATQLMYIYGDNGKEVVMQEQKSLGQIASRSGGRAAFYNNKTHQGEIIDPQTIQMFDLKTGSRPKALYPDLGGSAPKPEIKPFPRTKLQRPARNSTERNSFTGH